MSLSLSFLLLSSSLFKKKTNWIVGKWLLSSRMKRKENECKKERNILKECYSISCLNNKS